MGSTRIQGGAPAGGAARADELNAWRDRFSSQWSAAWGNAGKSKAALQRLADSALTEPVNGVSLRELPFEVAQQILTQRAEAMREFFDSWAESIRQNAEADKQAALRRMLMQLQQRAVRKAQSVLRAPPARRPIDIGRATALRPAESLRAVRGVEGAFTNTALAGLNPRRPDFG